MTLKPRVLIVDDESDLLDVISDQVQAMGYETLTASDGIDAFEIIERMFPQGQIDLVVSDINMPKMDGIALLRKVREAGWELPFIFVTGKADKDKVIAALKLGAMNFLEKPFANDALSLLVREGAEFGIMLKAVEVEISKMLEENIIADDKAFAFKMAYKAFLLTKSQHKIILKAS